MEWIQEHWVIILPIILFLVGWLLPPLRIKQFGEKIGGKIPKDLKDMLIKEIDAFEKGLIESNVNGNDKLISNAKLRADSKKLKIELGLGK